MNSFAYYIDQVILYESIVWANVFGSRNHCIYFVHAAEGEEEAHGKD